MLRVWANLDINLPLAEVAAAARRAEAMGFDCISAPDVMHDGLLTASVAIQATKRIKVATSALVCFPRSPMTVAVAAWNLQAYSEGRFRLGLGPLVAPNIIQKYSTPWYPPAPRMREYVQSLRAIFHRWQNGVPLDYRGKYYSFTRQQDFTAPSPIAHPDIPIHLAAIGPRMTALAGEVAGGLFAHPTNTSPEFITRMMFPDIEAGLARSGRKRSDLEVIACPFYAIGRNDDEIAARWSSYKSTLATVFSTPNYWRSLDLFGIGEVGLRLRELTRANRWCEMNEVFTKEMADLFIYRAHYKNAGVEIRERYDGIATAIALPLPSDPSEDLLMKEVIADLHR